MISKFFASAAVLALAIAGSALLPAWVAAQTFVEDAPSLASYSIVLREKGWPAVAFAYHTEDLLREVCWETTGVALPAWRGCVQASVREQSLASKDGVVVLDGEAFRDAADAILLGEEFVHVWLVGVDGQRSKRLAIPLAKLIPNR